MRNPFNPGSGVPPPYLAGRERHLEAFERALESIEDGHVENMIVHGLRGTGKTVLLTEFNKIRIKKWVPSDKEITVQREIMRPRRVRKSNEIRSPGCDRNFLKNLLVQEQDEGRYFISQAK
jgi:hypothetical protein